MELRWLDDALADITEIYDYIAADDPMAAARVVERIQGAVRLLTRVPHRGCPGRWPGPRARHSAHVIHRALPRQGDAIEILRVFHTPRRWPNEPAG